MIRMGFCLMLLIYIYIIKKNKEALLVVSKELCLEASGENTKYYKWSRLAPSVQHISQHKDRQ